jgi:hypothetical protein
LKDKEEVDTKLAKALEDIEELKKAAGDDDDDDGDDGISKRDDVPEDVRKAMNEQSAEIKKQAGIIAKMVEDTERKEFIAKATDNYADLSVPAEDLGEALRLVSKNAPDALGPIEKALAAGNAAMKKQFNELGDDEGGDDGDSALGKLNKIAEDISKKDGITFAKAFVQAKNANPDLWKESREERHH